MRSLRSRVLVARFARECSLGARCCGGGPPSSRGSAPLPPHPLPRICVSVVCVCRWVCIHRGCVSPSWVCVSIVPAPPVGVGPQRPVLGPFWGLRFKRGRLGALPSLRLGVSSAPSRSRSGGSPSPRLGLAALAPLETGTRGCRPPFRVRANECVRVEKCARRGNPCSCRCPIFCTYPFPFPLLPSFPSARPRYSGSFASRVRKLAPGSGRAVRAASGRPYDDYLLRAVHYCAAGVHDQVHTTESCSTRHAMRATYHKTPYARFSW